MVCTIVDESSGGSVQVGGGWAISLTTVPVVGTTVDWSGDLGEHPHIFQDGHQLVTSWDTPGTKTLKARCESDERVFVIIVNPCMIYFLDASRGAVKQFEPVLINAETFPAASVNAAQAERRLAWSGDLGTQPEMAGNSLVTHWETQGLQRVTVACGSAATASIFIEVSDEFDDPSLWRPADVERRRQKRVARLNTRDWGLSGVAWTALGTAITLSGPVGWALAVCAGGIAYSGASVIVNNYNAAEPPRDDFDVVSRFDNLTSALPVPVNETHAIMLELIVKAVAMVVCQRDLVISYERLSGALEAAINDQGRTGTLIEAPFVADQVAAIVHNASKGAQLMTSLLSSIGPTNDAYQALVDPLRVHLDELRALSADDIQAIMRDSWNAQTDFRVQFGLSASDMGYIEEGADQAINDLGKIRNIPNEVFDQDAVTHFADMAARLHELAVAYDALLH
jgi:hypothetical protein